MSPRVFHPNAIRVLGDTALMALYDRTGEVTAVTTFDGADISRIELHRWFLQRGYGRRRWGNYVHSKIDGVVVSLHRHLTECPAGLVVDHVNGNGLDNRRNNLRVCTQHQNNLNRRWRTGRELPRGVYRNPNGSYRAHITVKFDTLEEAIAQRQEWERIYHGEFAHQEVG